MSFPKRGEKAFTKLASFVFECPSHIDLFSGDACFIVSYPDDLGNLDVVDLDAGQVFQTNIETLVNAKHLRQVEEADWGFSFVASERGHTVDEDLEVELSDYLMWK